MSVEDGADLGERAGGLTRIYLDHDGTGTLLLLA
jgi:hypothetical protein